MQKKALKLQLRRETVKPLAVTAEVAGASTTCTFVSCSCGEVNNSCWRYCHLT